MKLLSTLAYLCISKRHCCVIVVEIRYTPQSTLCIFRLIFQHEINQYATYTSRNNLHFWQHYLVTVYMATIVVIQSVCVCSFFFSPSLPFSHFKFALNTFLGKGFSFINGVCPGDKQGASCISISAKTMLSL